MRLFRSVVGLVCAVVCGLCGAAEVQVAVAANFTLPMQKIAVAFTQDTGHKVRLSFGATGGFYAQIKNGAPFEVLLAADAAIPSRLEAESLAVSGSRFTYAVGRLVLWSKRMLLGESTEQVQQLLQAGRFERLALADPKLAPYGAAAQQVLDKLGVLQAVTPRVVQGENVTQAYQFVATGNAALGFVALSQVWADGRVTEGSIWLVPPEMYSSLQQDAVLLRAGQNHPAALALLQYLKTDKVRSLIRAWGYELPTTP